jgi:hypothetical protein
MLGNRLGPIQERVAEKLVPDYIKDKIDQVDDRLGALESWKSSNVAQWATGVDNSIDEIAADQKALAAAQAAIRDNLSTARDDAANMATAKLAIPENMSPADLGATLGKIRDISAASGQDFFRRIWDMLFGGNYAPLENLVRMHSQIKLSYDSGFLRHGNDILRMMDDWFNTYKVPLQNMVVSGVMPAKVSATIQSWISAQADAIKGTISAQQLSTDKLNAISALLNKVPGTSTRLIDSLSGVSQWYNTKEAYIRGQIDTYITAYNSDTLPALIKSQIDKYTDVEAIKNNVLAKIGDVDLAEKLKAYLMSVPGVEGVVDTLYGVYEGLAGFVDKLIAAIENAKQQLHYLRVNAIEGNIETMQSVISNGIKNLKKDLDRDPGQKPENIKQYAKDAVNDVRSIVEATMSSIRIILGSIGDGLEKFIMALYTPIKDFSTSTLAALSKTVNPDMLKAGIRKSPAAA